MKVSGAVAMADDPEHAFGTDLTGSRKIYESGPLSGLPKVEAGLPRLISFPEPIVTAKDIAAAIRQDGETLQTAIDRLKNWTSEGLIKASGDLHPGKGRSRQYAPKAVADAAVMQALVNAGLTAVAAARVVARMAVDE